MTRAQIAELDTLIKSIPSKRKPTEDEHTKMYALRDSLQKLSGAIYLNIKCGSSNRRLQCSFNRFQAFMEQNPARIVAKSESHQSHEFRGGAISAQLVSSRRVFKKKMKVHEIPKVHEIDEVHEAPKVQEIDEVHEIPKVQEAPKVQEVPKVHEIQEAQEVQ